MDLQNGKRMFGDIKSKLGFGSHHQDRSSGDLYDDGYDDYDEYAEYGEGYDDYADDYADDYDAGSSYDRYAPVTTRSASSRTSGSSTMPRLVSIDDVRASTPSSLSRSSSSTSTSSRSLGRTMVDSSLPPQMTPEGTAAVSAAASRRHSEGLDSLFMPTDGASQEARAEAPAVRHAASATADYATSASAAKTTTLSSLSGRREVSVVAPRSYEDAEEVSRKLKAGDAVILVLQGVANDLRKRLLDFSFGVASALDGSVECVGDHVFAITRGKALTEVERMNLRNQGVL